MFLGFWCLGFGVLGFRFWVFWVFWVLGFLGFWWFWGLGFGVVGAAAPFSGLV